MNDDLASVLAQAVAALHEGKHDSAIPGLREVVENEAFRVHPDLQDVRARTCSLLAQALLATDEVGPADRYAREALDALELAPDPLGRAEVDGLRKEIMSRAITLRREQDQRQRRERLRHLPLQEIIDAASDDAECARMLIERATADNEAGDHDAARRTANRARNLADRSAQLKEQVLSRLLVAQVDPDQRLAALRSAYQLALAADEPGLITGIARTATQVGIPLEQVDRGHS